MNLLEISDPLWKELEIIIWKQTKHTLRVLTNTLICLMKNSEIYTCRRRMMSRSVLLLINYLLDMKMFQILLTGEIKEVFLLLKIKVIVVLVGLSLLLDLWRLIIWFIKRLSCISQSSNWLIVHKPLIIMGVMVDYLLMLLSILSIIDLLLN